jgi:hypothetical protein
MPAIIRGPIHYVKADDSDALLRDGEALTGEMEQPLGYVLSAGASLAISSRLAGCAVMPPSLDGGTVAPLVSPDGDFDDGESSLTTSFMHAGGWSSVFVPGVVGTVAALGAVAAGAAIVEAALLPGTKLPRAIANVLVSGRVARQANSLGSAKSPAAPMSSTFVCGKR